MDGDAAHFPPPNHGAQDNGSHLWIPEPEVKDPMSGPSPSSSRTPQLLRERLYVGNLSPTVDEYTLLQVFTKFGKVAKLDFLFHKSGINKGRPRGYAFVEYMNEADATRALQTAHGRLLRGRKLVVTFAQQAPSYDTGSMQYAGRSRRVDATPTALSLVKSGGIARPEAKTSSKIAIMEAKLRQMADSSSFADRPALPSRLVAPPMEGRGPISGKIEWTKNDGGGAHGGLTALSSTCAAESSDMVRMMPSSKQRSIPGVKIVRGGSNKGISGVPEPT